MIKRLVLWYSKKRKKIWTLIGIVAGVLIAFEMFKYAWKQSRSASDDMDNIDNGLERLNTISLQESESVLSGENISNGKVELLTTLDEFAKHCNEGKINEAYSLLSDECKAQLYPNVETFKTRYFNKVFSSGKKDITAENWIGNIYKVNFLNDALSTGVYDKASTIQDYITITKDVEGNAKLNINNYIGKEEINKESEADNIKIKAIEKNIYMKYETYTFEIINNSTQAILIANIDNMNDMYLLDNNNLTHRAYVNELTKDSLKVEANQTAKITIKYYNSFISSRRIEKIVFANIKLNYSEYANNANYAKIEIDI